MKNLLKQRKDIMKATRLICISTVVFFLAGCSLTQILVRKGTPYKDLTNSIIIQIPVVRGIKEFSWSEQTSNWLPPQDSRINAGEIFSLLNYELRNQLGILPINCRKILMDETQSILSRNGIVLDSVKNLATISSLFKKLFPQDCYLLYPTDFHLNKTTLASPPAIPPGGLQNSATMYSGSLELTLIDLKNDQVVSKVVASSLKADFAEPIQSIANYCARSSLMVLFGFTKKILSNSRAFFSPNMAYSSYLFNDSIFFNSSIGLTAKPFKKQLDTMAITNSGNHLLTFQNNPFSFYAYNKNLIEVFNIAIVTRPEEFTFSENSDYFIFRINGTWNVFSLNESRLRNDSIKTGILKSGEQFYCILTGETETHYTYIALRTGKIVSLNKDIVSEFK